MSQSRKVISTAGGLAAGKGTFGQFAQDYGFTNISTGELIRGELLLMGEDKPTRDRQLAWGNARRYALGPGYWAEAALQLVEGDVIIDGIRSMGELESVRQADGILIWFESPLELTFRWSQERKQERDRVTLKEFVRQQNAEFGDGQMRPAEQPHLAALRKAADVTITNDVDEVERTTFLSKIQDYLESIRYPDKYVVDSPFPIEV